MKLRKSDLLIGILVTILWGCNFTVIEMGLRAFDPFALTFLRFFFCAFPAVLFLKRPTGVSFKLIAAYGVLFGVGLWGIMNLAMYKGLSAGICSVFLQFSAFFTIILSALLLKEKISLIHIRGIVLSVTGLFFLTFVSNAHSTTAGIVLLMFAALAWASCNIIVKISKPADMIAFIVWSSTFSAPAVFALTLLVLSRSRPFRATYLFPLPFLSFSKRTSRQFWAI